VNCLGKTQNGEPCGSHARSGSDFCYFHDPASGRQRREAQRKGGRNRSRVEAIPSPPCNFDSNDPSKIGDFLNLVVNRLVNGQMEAKVAYAVGYILNIALKLKEVRQVDEQIPQAKRFQSNDRADGFPGDFAFNGDGIELTELPKEAAMKVLADLNDSELSHRLNEFRGND
jgi:hypothetical protein